MPVNVPTTAAQEAALRINTDRLQAFWAGSVLPAVARRWAWWESMLHSAQRYGVDPSLVAGGALVKRNRELDLIAMDLMRMASALDQGEAYVQPWSLDLGPEGTPALHMGIALRGHGPGDLGLWPLALGILKFTAWSAVGTGIFVLTDGFLDGRAIEAEADLTHAQSRKAAADAINLVGAQDPQAAAALADAVAKADLWAARPDALDKLADAALGVAKGAASAAGSVGTWLPWAVGIYLLTQTGRGKRLVA